MHVRNESNSETTASRRQVCFTPMSRHPRARQASPLCAPVRTSSGAVKRCPDAPGVRRWKPFISPSGQISFRESCLDQPLAEKLLVLGAFEQNAVAHVVGRREIGLHRRTAVRIAAPSSCREKSSWECACRRFCTAARLQTLAARRQRSGATRRAPLCAPLYATYLAERDRRAGILQLVFVGSPEDAPGVRLREKPNSTAR